MPSVSSLFFRCSPFAIRRLIVPIVVDTLNRGASGPSPHVPKEGRKGVPLSTHGYTPASIPEPFNMIGVVAAVPHILPRSVSGGVVRPSSVSVIEHQSRSSRFAQFDFETPTRLRVSRSEASCAAVQKRAALAKAQVFSEIGSVGRSPALKLGNHFKPFKLFSYERYSSRHDIGSFNVVFSGGRPAATGAHCDISETTQKGNERTRQLFRCKKT